MCRRFSPGDFEFGMCGRIPGIVCVSNSSRALEPNRRPYVIVVVELDIATPIAPRTGHDNSFRPLSDLPFIDDHLSGVAPFAHQPVKLRGRQLISVPQQSF